MSDIKTVLTHDEINDIICSKRNVGASLEDICRAVERRAIERAVLAAATPGQVDARITRLTAAIEATLRENAHLADGEDCTLIHLKRAIAAQSTEGAKG